jgi:hypothetical protein
MPRPDQQTDSSAAVSSEGVSATMPTWRKTSSSYAVSRARLRAWIAVVSAGLAGLFAPAPIAAKAETLVQLDVAAIGRGTVTATITEPGIGEVATQTCDRSKIELVQCSFMYRRGRSVTLTATSDAATFRTWSDGRCSSGPVCTLPMDHEHQSIIAVFSDDEPLSPTPPPAYVSVRFNVGPAGAGSGRIRSATLDCGLVCTTVQEFGTVVSLVAEPDHGSRFVEWRGACSSEPTCQLAVGPVTRVTAVFEPDDAPFPRSSCQLRFSSRRFLPSSLRRVSRE